jgi:hypothetical protein
MLKNLKSSFIEVFSNWKYILITFLVASIFTSFNLLIQNYRHLIENLNPKTIYFLLIGGLNSISNESLVNLFIISILAGILISMIIYKINTLNISSKKSTGIGGLGIIIGTLAPACSACGFGLLALLGYGGVLFALPFAGLELAWLSMIALTMAIIIISNQIAKKTCRTK